MHGKNFPQSTQTLFICSWCWQEAVVLSEVAQPSQECWWELCGRGRREMGDWGEEREVNDRGQSLIRSAGICSAWPRPARSSNLLGRLEEKKKGHLVAPCLASRLDSRSGGPRKPSVLSANCQRLHWHIPSIADSVHDEYEGLTANQCVVLCKNDSDS